MDKNIAQAAGGSGVIAVKRPAVRALTSIMANLWAIEESAFAEMVSVVQRKSTPEMLEKYRADPFDHSRLTGVRENVGVIRVHGTLFKYANLFTEFSGGTSYESVAKSLAAMADDESIDYIVMDFDSPGGQASGCHELAAMIREVADNIKPVVAYVGGLACSAAYWLASACNSIAMDRTAMVGSIGTVVRGYDDSKAREKEGVREYTIVSSQSPNKALNPAEDAGRAAIQVLVDKLSDVFIEQVAVGRGTTYKDVASNYGKGGVMLADDAIKLGMADSLASLEQIIADLQEGKAVQTKRPVTMTAVHTGEEVTMTRKELQTKFPDLFAEMTQETMAAMNERDAALAASQTAQAAAGQDRIALTAANERIAALEKTVAQYEARETLLREQACAASAASILTEALNASTIPASLHAKVKVPHASFVKDGALDAAAYKAHVVAEVGDWEGAIGASGAAPALQGSAAPAPAPIGQTKTGGEIVSEKEMADFAKYAGVELGD